MKRIFINKQTGRRVALSQNTIKILGGKLYNEWVEDKDIQSKVVKLETKEIPVAPKVEDVPILENAPIVEQEEPKRKGVREIREEIPNMTEAQLKELLEDDRVTVKEAAKKELNSRNDDGN